VHGEDHDGFGASDDDDGSDDGPLRGWVPPDDRLWLHPSERGSARVGATPAPRSAPSRPAARGSWVAGGLTVCVVLALVLTGMVVATTGDSGPPSSTGGTFTGVPTTEADLSRLATNDRMVRLASTARSSTVALIVDTGHGTRVGTGVVAEAGGIIVTLRPIVADQRSVTVVEPDGTRQPAVEVGTDTPTGIVVLRIADDLPVAEFTAGDPATGSLAVAMSEEAGGRGGAPTTHAYAGTVLYAGLAAGPGQPSGFCGTAIDAPLSAADIGSPLMEPSGAVAGLLDTVEGAGAWRTAVFLPAELVRDVTAQIVSNGSVDHGVLGTGVVDPTGGGTGSVGAGAVLTGVVAGGSAAQAGLESGDRIIAVNGSGVRSAAELATRLYADAPGAELAVTFVRDGTTGSTTAVLADSQG